MNFGLYGKYPFNLGAVTIFPLFGAEVQWYISSDTDWRTASWLPGYSYKDSDLSALWVKFGVGSDFSVSGKVFLRVSLLYGFRLYNSLEEDLANYADKNDYSESIFSSGPDLKFAVGFRFL
ncbi:hypothetical protein K7I13_10000 [Brucepastera parasyntrophica]|uniref:hypothetical protein n=1 Tax=Brucepastera parasyntrophica TaxID=2880008 RepID=UPI00210C2664|nr:hypothetical protein [Brucepastera parasyntrophica]ULQ58860.1 hypothetical protein K7I13_10000 [Brucepastera parasyntrophica]